MMNIIVKVRKAAVEDSTYNYIKIIKNEVALVDLNNNIYEDNYTLEDDKQSKLEVLIGVSESKAMYEPIKRRNVRAKLPMLTDIEDIVDWKTKKVLSYLYENLAESTEERKHEACWLTTAYSGYSFSSHIVYYEGRICGSGDTGLVSSIINIGFRPIIEVSKK